jgi:hypothetical protein
MKGKSLTALFVLIVNSLGFAQDPNAGVGVGVSMIDFASRFHSRWYQDSTGWFVKSADGAVVREPTLEPNAGRTEARGGWGPTYARAPWNTAFSVHLIIQKGTAVAEAKLSFDASGQLTGKEVLELPSGLQGNLDLAIGAIQASIVVIHSIYDSKR